MKDSRVCNLIKATAVAGMAILIVIVVSRLVVLKSRDGINQMQALYKQPKNTIDVLFLGSSLVYCNISPGILWEEYGIASFDLAGAEAPPWVSYYMLKEALKTQKPKLICYEVSIPAIYPTPHQSDEWSVDNNYGMKWNLNRIMQLYENSDIRDFYRRLIPMHMMHGRYNDLSENDFKNKYDSSSYKGFKEKEGFNVRKEPDISSFTDSVPCSQKAEDYIRRIIDLASDEGIPIMLFVSPRDCYKEEHEICNYIGSVAVSEGAKYRDFNSDYDQIGIDFETDMADGTHLNYKGYSKFTRYLGSTLNIEYDLPDRRGDSNYVSWDIDSARQRNERNNNLIKESENAAEVLSKTGDGYIVFAINDDEASVINNSETVREIEISDKGYKLSYQYGGDSFLMTDTGDYGQRMCSFFVNDEEYLEPHGNRLFVYDNLNRLFVRSIEF